MEILELNLLSNNLSDTKNFYQNTIGFNLREETQHHLSFDVGSSILRFDLVDAIQKPTYHFAFTIPSNKINEAMAWTLKRTALIEHEDKTLLTNFDDWKAKAIYFFDNNQNIVEFISRADLNNPDDNPFSIESIISISEVGLVTDFPIQLGNEIIEKTQITFFEKGPKREDFAAVGNDTGLFVISNPNRNWYPTKQQAQPWKVKTKIRSNKKDYDLEFN